eukprot:CAMPEP_0195524808 /NCGR_PEP_ID=MMETSP0794_2-20130614/24869_1 /TAXON_ID=515487 /ORGANISM="Stephanopyxis turris, Strain CCMP 815" /LENGTH=330 /DNA_ID=CAMNT_0040655115 /DNA_START=35 /DNA_END=1027 /DNA_ORIENTATION=+
MTQTTNPPPNTKETQNHDDNKQEEEEEKERIVLIKLGGSSITDKATIETLNDVMLEWIANVICSASSNNNNNTNTKFIILHGAGSFGHHMAKEYGLRGQSHPAPSNTVSSRSSSQLQREHSMQGLAKTRLSVLRLNWEVCKSFIHKDIPAVGISPFSIPCMQAHGGDSKGSMSNLARVVRDSMDAGLLPVLHGDACLYGDRSGILGGDTLAFGLGTHELLDVDEVIFMTDVDGVYTSDPNDDIVDGDSAELMDVIRVDESGIILSDVCASGSSHDHDVTGGLRTKLKASADIAKNGIDVKIVKCGSASAVQAVLGEPIDRGTIIRLDPSS